MRNKAKAFTQHFSLFFPFGEEGRCGLANKLCLSPRLLYCFLSPELRARFDRYEPMLVLSDNPKTKAA